MRHREGNRVRIPGSRDAARRPTEWDGLATAPAARCLDACFADATVRCELPPGHAGTHQAQLPRRHRVQWSVLVPS